jgi:hypothetical protein
VAQRGTVVLYGDELVWPSWLQASVHWLPPPPPGMNELMDCCPSSCCPGCHWTRASELALAVASAPSDFTFLFLVDNASSLLLRSAVPVSSSALHSVHCDKQGASLGAFMALLDVEAVHGPALWDEVRRIRWRRSSFQVHAGKNSQLDGCAVELGKVVEAYHGRGESRHIVLAWGAGQFQSSMRGNPAAPTSQIQRAMSRLYRVVEVDEAYTSSYHYESGLPLQRVRSKSKGKVVRGLQWCPDTIHDSCSSFVGRDANSAKSIRWILMRGPNNRPAQFIWDAHRGKLQKPVGKVVDDHKLQRRHVRGTGRARRAATAATSVRP